MPDYSMIVRERQKLIRREIDRRKITIKAVQLDGGWEDPSTVLSYFPADKAKQPAGMSVSALHRLLDTKALPAELLSLLLPEEFAIVRKPEGLDLDEFEALLREFLAAKGAAHHPESECGREIGPGENVVLLSKAAKVKAAAA